MLEARGQVGAFDELHNHYQLIVGCESGPKRGDIRMVEVRHQLDLAQEASGNVLPSREIGEQNLHGFDAIGENVSHLVHSAHAAAAQLVENLVVANPLAGFFWHKSDSSSAAAIETTNYRKVKRA